MTRPAFENAPAAPRSRKTPRNDGLSWGALSKDLPPRVRPEVVTRFREAGGDFARWSRLDREHLADALTRTEDWLELEHPNRHADRAALKAARRRLELELWP